MTIPPKNLQDLLKFAIQHQKNGTEAEFLSSEIDLDRKLFLENVLKSMTIDVIEELNKAICVLEDTSSTKEERNNALCVIRDYIDNIDLANSFVKIGGTGILIKCIRDEDTLVRTSAINVLAEMSQNNPFCQQTFLDCDLVKVLINYLNEGDERVVASSLYALSALMRNFDPAITEFSKCDGVTGVLHCLSSKCSRVFAKTCFLISSLSSQFPAVRDAFVKSGAFDQLSENLDCVSDFDVKTEALIVAMATLIESEHFQPGANVKNSVSQILKRILHNIKGLPQCEEMEIHSKKILDKLQ